MAASRFPGPAVGSQSCCAGGSCCNAVKSRPTVNPLTLQIRLLYCKGLHPLGGSRLDAKRDPPGMRYSLIKSIVNLDFKVGSLLDAILQVEPLPVTLGSGSPDLPIW